MTINYHHLSKRVQDNEVINSLYVLVISLEMLSNNFKSHFSKTDRISSLTSLNVGESVALLHEGDWVRGVVSSQMTDSLAAVHLVDIGSTVLRPWQNLFSLPQEFCKLPAQVVL